MCMSLVEEVIALTTPDKPKILVYDIETTPIRVKLHTWDVRKLEHSFDVKVELDSYLLCVAYKWLGNKHIQWIGLNQNPDYDPTAHDDRWLAEKLWRLHDKADWVIAHNGDRFDQRKANARFFYHEMPPPQSYQSIDTLKVARKHFEHTSNKLDELGRVYLGQRKEKHAGLGTWFGCMDGDPKMWRTMKKYSIQDVQLLEDFYLRVRPWINGPSMPNMSHWSNGVRVCRNCGHDELVAIGTYRAIHEYQEWRCTNCESKNRSRLRRQEDKGNEPRTV